VFIFFLQRPAERVEAAAHVCLHGSLRDAHGGGDLAFGQVKPVAQHDRLASARGQGGQGGQQFPVVLAQQNDVLRGGLVPAGRCPQPRHAQVPAPVPGEVAHAGPDVADRGLRVPQRTLLLDQPGERLLGDVLGVVRAEQISQPDHLRVPFAEEPAHAYRP
jgi:hypothetical protein